MHVQMVPMILLASDSILLHADCCGLFAVAEVVDGLIVEVVTGLVVEVVDGLVDVVVEALVVGLALRLAFFKFRVVVTVVV